MNLLNPFIKKRSSKGFESGQALVEFALVFPLLLTLMFGIIETGYFFYHQYSLDDGVQQGARAGALGSTNSKIVSQVKQFSGLKLEKEKIEIKRPDKMQKGSPFIVTASYNHRLLTPLFDKKFFHLKSSCSMAVE